MHIPVSKSFNTSLIEVVHITLIQDGLLIHDRIKTAFVKMICAVPLAKPCSANQKA